jgi:hypothetical protein
MQVGDLHCSTCPQQQHKAAATVEHSLVPLPLRGQLASSLLQHLPPPPSPSARAAAHLPLHFMRASSTRRSSSPHVLKGQPPLQKSFLGASWSCARHQHPPTQGAMQTG